MLVKKSIFAATLLTSVIASSATQASEINLEQVVSRVVSTTLLATQQEIQWSIQQAMLTASNIVNLGQEQDSLSTEVDSITLPLAQSQADLASE